MTESTEQSTSLKRGYYEFAQDTHYCIIVTKDGVQPPVLSERAVVELELARHNAMHDAWSILDWQLKKAVIQKYLLGRILYAECGVDNEGVRHAIENKDAVWEAIRFVDKWVIDVYPFRDNRPTV